jgi:hypothetical protein
MMEKTSPTPELYRDPTGAFEYMVMTFHPGHSLSEARRALTEQAEYGKWELRRSLTYVGGRRRFWLRRRLMRVERTLPPLL